jgi:hypothetical protein
VRDTSTESNNTHSAEEEKTVNTRTGFLKLATLVAVVGAALAPAAAHAQTNRGQVVQAVVKLNQAQLTFAKKLAEDAQFAAQFDKAAASGNNDAVATLAASVTGLPKSSISVSRGAGGDDNHEAANAAPAQSIYKLASFSRSSEPKLLSGKVCFDLVVVYGCIAF